MHYLECNGSEASIAQCIFDGWGSFCGHYNDVGVSCLPGLLFTTVGARNLHCDRSNSSGMQEKMGNVYILVFTTTTRDILFLVWRAMQL